MPADRENVVPLRDHVNQRFDDNRRLYDERNQEITDRLQRMDDQSDVRHNEIVGRLEKLESGKASGESLETYKRWQLGLVVSLVCLFVAEAVTLAIAVYSYTRGQVP